MSKIGFFKQITGLFLLVIVLHSLFYISTCRTISFCSSKLLSEKSFFTDFNKSLKKMINEDIDEEEKKDKEEEEKSGEKEFKGVSEHHLPLTDELEVAFIYQIKIKQIEKENYTELHVIDILIPPPRAS